jgi:predicted acetyltransferase
MATGVRQIEPDELIAWSAAMAHSHGDTGADAAAIAAFRRDHYRPGDATRLIGAFDGSRVVGTYRSFATSLTIPGGASVDVAAVTNVGVVPTHRRQGLLNEMTALDLRADLERGETAAILIASEFRIYGRYGYGPATEHASWTFDRARSAFETAAEPGGALEVLAPAEALGVLPAIFERHRKAQPGEMARIAYWWEVDLGLMTFPGRKPWAGWVIVHRAADGTPDGFVLYHVEDRWEGRTPASKAVVDGLIAHDPIVEAALWRLVLDIDLVVAIEAENRRVEEPVVRRLVDARAAVSSHRTDFVWLRPLDVRRLLESRCYPVDGRVVVEVVDPAGLSAGRFRLDGGPAGGRCRPTRAAAGLRLPVGTLGSVVLGGVSLARLADAGRLDVLDPRALVTADALFRWPVDPWCTSWF